MDKNSRQCEFFSTVAPDPHIERGRQLLRAHPELKSLFGPYPPSAVYVLALVSIQILLAHLVSKGGWPWIFAVSYTAGACVNLGLFTLIHDISHNLVFRRPHWNFIVGFIANMPLFIPLSVNYRYYHLSHHRFMGQARRDVDMPTLGEAAWVGHIWWRKLLWLIFFFWPYGAIRSLRNFSVPKMDYWIAINCLVQIGFLAAIGVTIGFRGMAYFALSTVFSISISPAFGARGLLEHFVVIEGQETYSYYGPYNKISFNNGYHYEHHDLMGIAWKRLPRIREIAPEFYKDLYHHRSYFGLIWRFVFNPEYSLYRRIARKGGRGGPVDPTPEMIS